VKSTPSATARSPSPYLRPPARWSRSHTHMTSLGARRPRRRRLSGMLRGRTPPVNRQLEQEGLAGSAPTTLVAGAVKEFRRRRTHTWPARILLWAGTTYLSAGRIDEAASHARESLVLTRRRGARGAEAHALCLAGELASAGGGGDAESGYREALTLAQDLGMRPLVAHCHLGLGKLYRRRGLARAGSEASHHRDDAVPRDGDDVLGGEGGGRDEGAGMRTES